MTRAVNNLFVLLKVLAKKTPGHICWKKVVLIMSKSIYTYTGLAKIAKSKPFNAIKEYPIVTVTADTRKKFRVLPIK